MIGVLFVDDEKRVLDGLRRMLHGLGAAWDMRFAASGAAALKALAEKPADIVVSDMRMSEMDGAQLFAAIEALYPRTARILLTGQSHYEASLRLLGPSQIFLSKPCDGARLTQAIDRAVALRLHLTRLGLQKTMEGLRWNQPLLPAYIRIRDELLQASPSPRALAALIAADAGLERAFLRVADILYLRGRRVVHPYQAIRYLKPDHFRASIVAATLLPLVMDCGAAPDVTARLIEAARAVAENAALIARGENRGAEIGAQAFLAGLLHNAGAILLAANAAPALRRFMEENPASDSEAERSTFGASFGEIGGYLLAAWGLPDAIVEAVAHQNEPGLCADPRAPVLAALHAALRAAKKIAGERIGENAAPQPKTPHDLARAGT